MVVTVVVIATALEVKMVAVVGTALERGTSLVKGNFLTAWDCRDFCGVANNGVL